MSRKIKNGKFVDRTPEEEARLQQLRDKAAYYDDAGNMAKAKFKKHARIVGKFVPLLRWQMDKWNNAHTLPKVTGIFFVLLLEEYRHHAPFRLPIANLIELGFSFATQRRAVTILEKAGLISVERKHKKPPVITVLKPPEEEG